MNPSTFQGPYFDDMLYSACKKKKAEGIIDDFKVNRGNKKIFFSITKDRQKKEITFIVEIIEAQSAHFKQQVVVSTISQMLKKIKEEKPIVEMINKTNEAKNIINEEE